MSGDRFGIANGLVRITQCVVNGMHQGVNHWGLLIPREDNARPTMALQITNDRLDPSIVILIG